MKLVIQGYKVEIVVREATMTFTAEKEHSCNIAGTIKWDGCSDWDFQTDGVMPHFCGLGAIQDFNIMMVELHKLAAQHIKIWDADLAE